MNTTGKSQIDQARIEWGIRLRFSPMPRLDMDWIVTQLNSFRIGSLWECARTWEIMQERDTELQSSMNKRFEDVAGLEYEVLCDNSPEGQAHKAALEYCYKNLTVTSALEQDKIGDVSQLAFNIAKAHANYYSVHEMLMRVDDAGKKQVTFEMRECPVWFFESRRGYLGYLANIFDVYGQPLKTGEWLPAVGYGYMRSCSILFAMKHFSVRDWLLYSQRMGIPWIHGTTSAPQGSPEWNQALEMLQTLGNDGAVLTNDAVKITPIETSRNAHEPFEPIVEYCNRAYDRVFRGSDLASGSRAPSAGSGKVVGASVQDGEKDILLRRDAKWMTSILNFRVDRPVLAYLFGTEPKAWMRIIGPSDDNTDADLAIDQFLITAGAPLSMEETMDRYDRSLPEPGEVILKAVAPFAPAANGQPAKPGQAANAAPANGNANGNGLIAPGGRPGAVQTASLVMPGASRPQSANNYNGGAESVLSNAIASVALIKKGVEQFAAATGDDLEHVLGRLNEILQIKDDAIYLQKLGEFAKQFPALKADLLRDPAGARALQGVLSAALANGLAGESPALANDNPNHDPGNGHFASGGGSSNPARDKINDFLNGKTEETVYASVKPKTAALIKAATGEDVSDSRHFIDKDALIHIDRGHGVGQEKTPGHLPITKDDILRIPEIVADPDKVEDGGMSGRGRPTVKYTKRFNGTTYYVEEQWKGQKLLAAKTMYKIETPGNSATPKGGVSHTS